MSPFFSGRGRAGALLAKLFFGDLYLMLGFWPLLLLACAPANALHASRLRLTPQRTCARSSAVTMMPIGVPKVRTQTMCPALSTWRELTLSCVAQVPYRSPGAYNADWVRDPAQLASPLASPLVLVSDACPRTPTGGPLQQAVPRAHRLPWAANLGRHREPNHRRHAVPRFGGAQLSTRLRACLAALHAPAP